MAAIETIAGITKLENGLFEITGSTVEIGAGIDDLEDAIFLIKESGSLRWGEGCDTTFTRCIFNEMSSSLGLRNDNYRY